MARHRPYFPKSRGRPQIDGLRVSSGIIFINRNGLSWRVTLVEHGPPMTLYNRWKRLSGSFLRRFLAFQAQALQQRGLPKELVDKLRKAARKNARAITATRWSGSRFFGLKWAPLRGPSHGSAAPCIHANRPMKRSSKTSIHSTHNSKPMGLTSQPAARGVGFQQRSAPQE